MWMDLTHHYLVCDFAEICAVRFTVVFCLRRSCKKVFFPLCVLLKREPLTCRRCVFKSGSFPKFKSGKKKDLSFPRYKTLYMILNISLVEASHFCSWLGKNWPKCCHSWQMGCGGRVAGGNGSLLISGLLSQSPLQSHNPHRHTTFSHYCLAENSSLLGSRQSSSVPLVGSQEVEPWAPACQNEIH